MARSAESQLMHAAVERYPTCPRCASASGYLTSWDDGGFLDVLMGLLRITGCRRRGGHFDLWCRTCYAVIATKAPLEDAAS